MGKITEKPVKTILYIFFSVLTLILSAILIQYIYIYLSPFIIATILASFINPVVNMLERKFSIPRGLSVLVVLVVLVTLLVILVIVGISQVFIELENLLDQLPDYQTLGEQFNWILEQNYRINDFINNLEISEAVHEMINDNLQLIYENLRNTLINIINRLLGLLRKFPLILLILFLSFIATFFISKDKDKINQFFVNLFPVKMHPKVYRIRDELLHSAMGLIRAQLILISITGTITIIGLIILDNQYAVVLGISAAILDLIPIIGPSLIFYPWILYNIILRDFTFAFSLLLLHTIIAAVRSGAEGKVIGHSLGLHPLSTMMALYVGYRTMGAIGILVGPSILIIIKVILKTELYEAEE